MNQKQNKNITKKITIISICTFLVCSLGWFCYKKNLERVEQNKIEEKQLILSVVKNSLDEYFHHGGEKPQLVRVNGRDYQLEYSTNNDLENHVKKLISRYRSAHIAVVVLDNETGNILLSMGHSRNSDEFGPVLPFTSTHPAASLFKIITAADLLENTPVTEDSRFKFHGRGTTLYKNQLKVTNSRWARYQSLEKAFAFSNNVVFGKAAINQSTAESLMRTAFNFGFNRDLMEEVNLSRSIVEMPENQYNFAELASGFNRDTRISPIHGAAIAATVANHGEFVTPRFLKKIIDLETGEVVWSGHKLRNESISVESATALKQMMELTVSQGTARGSFRRFDRKIRKLVTVGGKTGTITGGIPEGKRDWFTSFAVPNDTAAGKGISVCVMIVNDNKWYVKSAYMAKEIIEYYYKKILRIENAFLKDSSSQVRLKSEGRS
ncbi:MAG: hypothetical protein COW01_15210 [Bdellovibrionales bacterium CG12_big_fil_rev_8_21_14_0_65_38_15]|nr:MAG: hypothetical protein COW79_04685 [Bdellovibrionales bacterium CG22_combo_CG10-13_8_21_14_all_38_13]PIQ52711.1 MAG: hypothetical protein COW01_15210 [Bdellovibrionales bacterium CG12_big_fil_rev_8_21_14_0_65_38_15]PIR31077.1 MAG: hypothetical protein COV38_02305 [Bdellovibrionales bacterium CG11_big_fil_rev_8_21_14_0_20_38_13]